MALPAIKRDHPSRRVNDPWVTATVGHSFQLLLSSNHILLYTPLCANGYFGFFFKRPVGRISYRIQALSNLPPIRLCGILLA
jgi:hypothetical protein